MENASEKRRRFPAPWLVTLAVLLVVGWGLTRWLRQPGPAPGSSVPATNVSSLSTSRLPSKTRLPQPSPGDLRSRLAMLSGRLRPSNGPEHVRVELAELRQALRDLPPDQASRIVREFLDSGSDAPTGQSFKVGPQGSLVEAPTLRAFLLDQLAGIDPAGAAANARSLLEHLGSPDEWALALRNLARGDASEEGRKLLVRKLEAMMNHAPWQEQPSVGFLEAFDVAVHLRGTELLPVLTGLVRRGDNPAVAHAAYLALDRLTIQDAATTLAALQANPQSMTGREVTRANYFARADVRDEAQRRVVEEYLLNPALTADELARFSALYPNANFMVSHNLLTRDATPDHSWLVARDRESLDQVRRWLEDARFAPLRPHLQEIERRLQQFVRQAGP